MFFLDKKKKSQLNVLSEKEIQDKLYGRFRNNTGVASEPLPPPTPAKEAPRPLMQDKPKTVTVDPAGDLFAAPHPQMPSARENLSATLPPAIMPIKPKEPKELPQAVREDDKAVLDTVARFKKEVAFQKKKEESLLKRKPVTVKKRIHIDWSLAWKAMGSGCLAVFQWAGGMVIGFFSQINLRNPHFRRMLYWLSSVGLLLLLFWGIHYLNANREIAMKNSKKAVAVETTAPAAGDESGGLSSETVAPEVPLQEPAVRELPKVVAESETEVLKGYGVQVVTYVSEDDARSLVSRIKQAGFEAFVKTQRRSEGKIYYRVFLGPYEKYRRAQDELSRFKKADISRPFQDAFVLSLERRQQTSE